MGNSTIIELNNDLINEIERSPYNFARNVADLLRIGVRPGRSRRWTKLCALLAARDESKSSNAT